MPNFLWITHLDTFATVANLHKLAPHTWKGVPIVTKTSPNHRSVYFRVHEDPKDANWSHDLPCHDTAAYQRWNSLQRLVQQACDAIKAQDGGNKLALPLTLGRVMVSGLDYGTIPWHVDDGPYHDEHVRFHIPLVTNPLARVLSGVDSVHMETGSLWWINNKVPHTACNFGRETRYHIIFELRKAN